jgi:predicted nucleotidyltransferase
MKIHNILDEVFHTWSHIAVLRALQNSTQGMSGREIARAAKMTAMASLKALTTLENISVVKRQQSGRSHIFRLNRENVVVTEGILPLLQLERDLSKRVYSVLKKRLGNLCQSIIVFGSVARKEEEPGSDLDVCFIVNGEADKKRLGEMVYEIAPRIRKGFGTQLAPLFYTLREFRSGYKKNKPPIPDIVRDGIVITGKSIWELRGGTKDRP